MRCFHIFEALKLPFFRASGPAASLRDEPPELSDERLTSSCMKKVTSLRIESMRSLSQKALSEASSRQASEAFKRLAKGLRHWKYWISCNVEDI